MENKFKEDEIVSIELLEGEVETIDISVSDNNLFIANGILTHNCGFNTSSPGMENISESIGLAATADLICSLWREEEDIELVIINMGLQKNRFGPNFGSAAFKCNYNTLTLKETNKDYFEEDGPSAESVVKGADNALNSLINEE